MIRPVGEMLLVKWDEPKQESQGGIFIVSAARERTQLGHVLSKGKKVSDMLSVGDYVLVEEWGGDEVEIEDEGFCVLLRECDIVAKIVE